MYINNIKKLFVFMFFFSKDFNPEVITPRQSQMEM